MNQLMAVVPDRKMGVIPVWFHPHGNKIRHVGWDLASQSERTLLLKSNAVDVKIHPYESQEGWVVEYEIRHMPPSVSSGRVWMDTQNLKTAFGLSDECKEEDGGQNLLGQYGGDVASQAMYIRCKEYLNIPGPGTGNDGDPNVSIYLSEKLKEWVSEFLSLANQK